LWDKNFSFRSVVIDFSATDVYSLSMNQAPVVRPLAGRGEREEFKRIAKYCFADPVGWSDRIFPLERGDEAWGVFRGRTLQSGLVTREYVARLFGGWHRLSGISLVETPPEFRNNRNISSLFDRVLKKERESGKLFSALYPFSFEYYARYGYGLLGGPLFASFAPENIALEKPPAGEYAAYTGARAQLTDYHTVYETWVASHSFGIRPRRSSAHFNDHLAWSQDRIVLYYEGKTCGGFVRLHKKIYDNVPSDLEIRKIAWRDERAFRALMYLLQTHRNQIKEVKWYMPAAVPIASVMRNPRIGLQRLSDWMARPLDLPALCRLKAEERPAKNDIVFAVEDELLPQNTGTYRIRGRTVAKEKFRPELAVPLPLFSSMFFGCLSPADARLAGRLPPGTLEGADGFFTADPSIFVSEFF
jgi:predicted acetyltransferase